MKTEDKFIDVNNELQLGKTENEHEIFIATDRGRRFGARLIYIHDNEIDDLINALNKVKKL